MALRTETSEIDCLGLFATLFVKNINMYVEQGSYWEADSVSVSHDIPHTLCDPKTHQRVPIHDLIPFPDQKLPGQLCVEYFLSFSQP